MMNKLTDHGGERIKSCGWVVEGMMDKTVFERRGEEAYLSSEYYGDHTENWIVVTKGGKETMRFNAARVDSITWAEEGSA